MHKVSEIIWIPNQFDFPTRTVIKKSKLRGLVLVAFGIFIFFFVTPLIWKEPLGIYIFILPFWILSVCLVFNGINFLFYCKVITLREREVECDELWFLKRIHWKESIAQYMSINKIINHNYSTFSNRIRFSYELVLKHKKEKSRDITLFKSSTWKFVDEYWRNYAKIFKLKTLFVGGKREFEKSKEFLLDTREVYCKIQRNLNSNTLIKQESGYFKIESKVRKIGIAFFAFLISFLIMVMSYFFIGNFLLISGIGFLSVLFFIHFIQDYFGHEVLCVAEGGCDYWRVGLFWKKKICSIPVEMISSVRIDERECIVIDGILEKISFGQHLLMDEKVELRDFLITLFCKNSLAMVA